MTCWRQLVVVIVMATSCSSVSVTVPTTTSTVADQPTTTAASRTTTSTAPIGVDVGFDVEQIEVEIDDIFDEVHVFTASIPAGWERNDFGGVTYRPPEGSDFGFFTSIEFDNGCDGLCEPKDWTTALNNQDGILSRYRNDRDVVTDQALEDGWLLVFDNDDERNIHVFRWRDDAGFYFTCHAELDDDDVAYADDFTELCLAADAHWLRS